MVETNTRFRTSKVRKKSEIKDLVQFVHEFREAAEPLTKMRDYRERRLKNAPEKSIPFILQEIQDIDDGLVNLEAILNKLFGYYAELGEEYLLLEKKYQFTDREYRRCYNTMHILRNALHKLGVPAELNVEIVTKIQKEVLCQ